jgi:uncharacterized protein YecE (DUF72 family)
MKKHIYVGASGWHYTEWVKDKFYPADLPQNKWLAFYAKQFNTVELNNPFYHLPPKTTFQGWHKQTPKNFLFSVKASRYITHMKRLLDPKEGVSKFLKSAEGLKEKCGPILFQLPPQFPCNPERLAKFLKILPKRHQYTVEFRHPSWYKQEIYDLLKDFNAAFCIFELGELISPIVTTADFVYVRLHGYGKKYAGIYTEKDLQAWAKRFKSWYKEGKSGYCYFDNTASGQNTQNALRLKKLCAA